MTILDDFKTTDNLSVHRVEKVLESGLNTKARIVPTRKKCQNYRLQRFNDAISAFKERYFLASGLNCRLKWFVGMMLIIVCFKINPILLKIHLRFVTEFRLFGAPSPPETTQQFEPTVSF